MRMWHTHQPFCARSRSLGCGFAFTAALAHNRIHTIKPLLPLASLKEYRADTSAQKPGRDSRIAKHREQCSKICGYMAERIFVFDHLTLC